jgi:replicative DNA helicase
MTPGAGEAAGQVSVTEIAPRGGDFERTPPHDIDAERCVLGGMLLSKDAISDVLEVIRPHDHYRPAHQIVHEVILDLYGRGEPADAVTVAAELTRRGEVGRVGGADYLHTLIASVPTAANAGYYARIVRERAILRRLVEVGTRIVQLGYSGDGEADDLVDQAQAEVYAVTDRRVSEDYLPLSEIMPGALDEIESIGSHGGRMTGVPTGFADLDSLTNGLHPGQMVVIAARPALGKALALDTPLPTPDGWTTMGEVQVGDHLIGADGKPTRVVAATEIMPQRPCFEVEFDDGTVIVADAGHQWRTTTEAPHQGIKTTAQIAATLRSPGGGCQSHAVPVAQAAELPARDLAFPPYALGAWLGGGTGTSDQLASADPEIITEIEAEGLRATKSPGPRSRYAIRLPGSGRVDDGSTTAILRKLGVLGNKHIPAEYLRAAESQRRALLAGLLDTDGYVARNGTVQFAVTNRRLAGDTLELVLSLGYRARMTAKRVKGATEESSTCYMVTFTPADKVFRLTRKLARQSTRSHPTTRRRFIADVRPVPTVPVRCVQVDNPDHTYLAGRSWIPTHNSTLALDLARAASVQHGLATVIFSLEMSRNEITMRLLSAEARVPLHTMRTGQLSDDDWTRLARRMSEVVDAPLFIDDSPNLTLMEIRAKCRRLKQRNELRMVIIDYLQLMSSPRRVENRQQEVSEMSRSLKLLAKELDVPVVAVSQLNRGPEQRTDKRPMLSDLRESGCLTAETRILRADNGTEVTLAELLESGERDVPVWSLDERMRLVARPMTHAFPSGVKEVFRVRLTSGREVHATANHPFLSYDGWRPLGELTAGSRVAVPRQVPEPMLTREQPEPEIIMLAHLIGDGSFLRNQQIRYASIDEANLAAVTKAARHFGVTAIRDDYEVARCTSLRLPAPYQVTHGRRSPIAEWLIGLGLFDLRSHEKFIPAQVFSLPKRQLALFLRHLWATDGSVTVSKSECVRVYYATTSERLARDLQSLLLRFSIRGRLRAVGNTYGHPQWTLDVPGVDEQRRFLTEIGVHGERAVQVKRALVRLESMTAMGRFDTIPADVWRRVQHAMDERNVGLALLRTRVGTASRGDLNPLISPSRNRLRRIADALGDAELDMLASNDVYWDTIRSIDSNGKQPVYDATVLNSHNFVANGISVHNSIEQDSDMVILLHREDAYERESPRAGEADLVVAKHRNGPTATVTVAFQGHYSRFVDMAPG